MASLSEKRFSWRQRWLKSSDYLKYIWFYISLGEFLIMRASRIASRSGKRSMRQSVRLFPICLSKSGFCISWKVSSGAGMDVPVFYKNISYREANFHELWFVPNGNGEGWWYCGWNVGLFVLWLFLGGFCQFAVFILSLFLYTKNSLVCCFYCCGKNDLVWCSGYSFVKNNYVKTITNSLNIFSSLP